MCRFVVQIKKATLNGSDKLFHLTFVVRAPVSEAAWDWSSQVTKSLFPKLKWFSIHFSHPQFVKLDKQSDKVSMTKTYRSV